MNFVLEKLNNQYESIKFTVEEECDEAIPFLDIKIMRKDKKIEFDIYRKPTNTSSYIPSDSNHNQAHKYAAFQSMIHRMISIPLNKDRYNRELEHIQRTAVNNGYKADEILRMVKNAEHKKDKDAWTELTPLNKDDFKYMLPVHYHRNVNNKLKTTLKMVETKLVNRNQFKLKSLLGTAKDKVPTMEKAGIYKINCNDCESCYIGQTSRPVLVRYREHEASTRLGHKEKSAISEHMITNKHSFNLNNLHLVKPVPRKHQLNAWESLYMVNTQNLMNREDPPVNSFLLHNRNLG